LAFGLASRQRAASSIPHFPFCVTALHLKLLLLTAAVLPSSYRGSVRGDARGAAKHATAEVPASSMPTMTRDRVNAEQQRPRQFAFVDFSRTLTSSFDAAPARTSTLNPGPGIGRTTLRRRRQQAARSVAAPAVDRQRAGAGLHCSPIPLDARAFQGLSSSLEGSSGGRLRDTFAAASLQGRQVPATGEASPARVGHRGDDTRVLRSALGMHASVPDMVCDFKGWSNSKTCCRRKR
jgi:hypothetical protein